MLTTEEKYQAILHKDSSYEGVFYTGVTTTNIFCRPTCTARKPKKENVVFFDTAKEALQNGFRPCKVCKPLDRPGEMPEFLDQLIREINENPGRRMKDFQLRERGIDPVKVRRWFKKNYDLTFQGFQRMIRINNAFNEINSGKTVTHSAFEAGYESLSGFNDTYKSLFGNAPSYSHSTNLINIVRFATPLGPMYGCATKRAYAWLNSPIAGCLKENFSTFDIA